MEYLTLKLLDFIFNILQNILKVVIGKRSW